MLSIHGLRVGAAALLFSLGGCLSAPPLHPPESATPELRPEAFFAGRTLGSGQLEQRGHAARTLRVESFGRAESDGRFRLDQTVTFADGEVQARTWFMRRVDARAYTATLSDASGEVIAATYGNVFHLRYLLRNPAVYMEQWMYLQPDGRSVINLGTVTVAGVPWARLAEQIRRVD